MPQVRTLEQRNPFRSPCWRFDRVLTLVSHRPSPLPASRLYDDRYIRAYRDFLLRAEQAPGRDEQWALGARNPGMFYAHLLHHHPDQEYRNLLQARILSGLSSEEIAIRYLGTIPDAVHWYERLFFDVRDRLTCVDYIIKVIIGRWEDRQANRNGVLSAYQSDMMLKLFGYWGGPVILDFVVSAGTGLLKPKTADECGQWFDQLWERLVRTKSATAMYAHPFDRTTINSLFDAHYRLLDMAKQAETSGVAAQEYHKNVEMCLQSLTWNFGQRASDTKNALQRKYDTTAVEPRAAEMLELAAGVEPKQLTVDMTTDSEA